MSVVIKDDKKKVVVVVPKIEVSQTIEHNGTWGQIEGELDDQIDLKNALANKPNIGDALSLRDQNGIMFNGNTEIYETIDGDLSIGASNTIFGGTVVALNISGTNTGDQDLSGKVDKVTGKGLSANDYSNAEKTKLAGIEAGAQKNAEHTVIDANYVHTDNNYTHDEKTKLSSAVTSSTVTSIATLTQTDYDALPIKDPAALYVITGD
jgi:hypothetical protein